MNEEKETLKKQKLINDSYLLIIISFLAFYLRFYRLDQISLWTDECLTYWIATKESLERTLDYALGTSQQPLYYLFIHLWIKLFGKSELSLRFPSLIFGLVSIFMTYKLSYLLFKSKEGGIISTCLIAFSVFHISHSQDARPYVLAALLSILSTYYFIKVLEKDNLRNMIFYLIFSTLLIYTHSQGGFTLIAQAIFTFILWPSKKETNYVNHGTCLLLQFITFLLFLPWLFNIVIRIKNPDTVVFWIPQVSLIRVFRTFTEYLSGSYIIFFLFLCFIIAGLYLTKNKKSTYLLLLLFLVPILMLYGISKLYKPAYVERFTFCALIPYLILVAQGIEEIRKIVKAPFVILLILISLSLWFLPIRNYHKNFYPFVYKTINWRDFSKYIDRNITKDDLLILDSPFIKGLIFNYYPIRSNIKVTGFPYIFISMVNYEVISNQLDPLLKENKRVCLVKYHAEDKKGFIEKKIKESFKLTSVSNINQTPGWEQLSVRFFERK